MRIYFILTAVLVISSLTIPFTVNKINEKLTTDDVTVTTKATEEDKSVANTNEKETVNVFRTSTGAVVEMDIFEYIVGTVAGEMPASFSTEALKAQAIASYTYAKYINENSDENDSVLSDSSFIHQSYIDKTEQMEKWGEYYNEYKVKIEDVVKDVLGQYLTFNGKTAMTVFHALSADNTNSAQEIWGETIPYLVSVSSPTKEVSEKTFSFTKEEFKNLFKEKRNIEPEGADPRKWAKITEKSDNGYIRKLAVGNKTFSSVEITEILSLPSANFTAKYDDGTFVFTAKGKGHGVGMSQYGAEYMATKGKSYTEILSHFYPGTVLVKE